MSEVMDAGLTRPPYSGDLASLGYVSGSYADAALSADASVLPGGQGDAARFSEEAVRRFKESALKPLVKRAMSLEVLERRINVVKAEIEAVWNSNLPYEEKARQVSTKKNEISLLQAGQFEFAKSGFSRAA